MFFRCVESFGVCKRPPSDFFLSGLDVKGQPFPRCGEQKTCEIFSPLALAAVGR